MGNENSNNRRDRRCRSCSEIHDGNCRPNIRCFKCGERGHTSRNCDMVIVPNIEGCNHCGGKHASSHCRNILRKNAEEEQRKLELEKKVEKLEGQVDKMLKLSEEDNKSGEAASKNRKDNSVTNNNPSFKNSATQLDPHNMNPANFAGTPLQFNRQPPPIQVPAFSQSQNNPPFNQTQNQPFPNVFPNNFPGPLMNPPPPLFPNILQPYPNVQQSFPQPNPNVQSTHGYNQQHSFPNNQNVQPKFNNNADSQHMSDQTAQFKKPFQNQPNQFNQKKNLPEVNVNQQRGGRGGFNRGRGGNRGGWKNHYDNNNWKDNNNGNRNINNKGRGRCFRGNYNKEPQLFAGGKPNQTKTDNAEGNVSDNEKTQTERKEADTNDFRPNRNHQEVLREGIHKERKEEADANDFRPNRNHQGVHRGGIHKERVNIKGRGPPKVQRTNKNDNNSNCDSDSTGPSLETAPNTSEHKIKKRANRHKKERKESSNDSAENTSEKKLEEVDKENKENQPLSKNNLGEGDILMKYIGTNLPKITDAIIDNVSLYRKVEGVMLMSDPTSDEPILEPAKNLLHIIEFKSVHPKAKSFFC